MSSEFSISRFTQGGRSGGAPSHAPQHKRSIKEQIVGVPVPDNNELERLTYNAGVPIPVGPIGPPTGGGAQEAVLARIQAEIEQRRREEGTTPPSGVRSPGVGQDPTNVPADRPSMRTLNAGTPIIPVPIYCKATDCKFNKEKACAATNISVSAKGAVCETYQKRAKKPTAGDLRDRKKIRTQDLIKTAKGPAIVVKRESSGYRVVYPNRKQAVVPFKKYEVIRSGVSFHHLLI